MNGIYCLILQSTLLKHNLYTKMDILHFISFDQYIHSYNQPPESRYRIFLSFQEVSPCSSAVKPCPHSSDHKQSLPSVMQD